ncbi:DEAD/DEAH box helicase family protein [Streptomyces pristinaespiralis]|uniref:DEAD/DEAH box helicase family protein n=1 Tax=Streptomyces pristinaespiralis TaxID=38300 RepID=UPI0033F46518
MLRVLEEEDRPATADEQQILARWSGWGALPRIFEPRPNRAGSDSDEAHERAVARWEALDEVRERVSLLTPAEWDAARRNTINAHYTDPALVTAIWGAVRELGFDGGTVLEPGSGSGNFIGHAPTDTSAPVQMTGVEIEPTTAAISRHLYPDAEVITSGLEDVRLPQDYDAAIGNVPFGRYQPYDPQFNPDRALSIHDLAIYKALSCVRPGGVLALVTSRYTLDAQDTGARERMHEIGDLLGAIRLPAKAHRATAGTDVVTDVLLLRRRMPGEAPGDASWVHTTERELPGHDEPVHVNAYFDTRPEHVLGQLRVGSGPFGPAVTVTGPAQHVAQQLAEAGREIAERARDDGRGWQRGSSAESPAPRRFAPGVPEGTLGLDEDGGITIVDGGYHVPLEVHPEQRGRLVQLIRLKQQVRDLYEAEAATSTAGDTAELAQMRQDLRTAYQAYRIDHPSLAKPRQARIFTPKDATERAQREGLAAVPDHWKHPTAFALIDDDPDAALLFGLEEWDDSTKKAVEQAVLHQRVLEPRVLADRADTPEDALALALEHDGGTLRMARVAQLLGVDEDEAMRRVGHLAFRDPAQHGAWEPRHRYLSGNVRIKLHEARKAAESDPSFAGNVAALESVQPAPLAPSEIKAKLGATWIPTDVYTAFLRGLGFEDATVVHAGGTVWEVKGASTGDLAREEWGTPDRPTRTLMEALLRQTDSAIRVVWYDAEGRAHTDQEATDAAREKARLLAEQFEDWVWTDTGRATQLAAIYNTQFNNLVMMEHDTSPLTLPGLRADWHMRDHQNAAIRRILASPTALLAHVVGAGKTATMVGGAMELRRTGLANKPALVVPNHMLKQITREFRHLYPNAELLAISASDLGKTTRRKFMARAAGGNWDAVIFTHEAFNRLPLKPETVEAYLTEEIASLREQLEAAAEAGMDSRTVKQVETALVDAEASLKQQMDRVAKDAGVFLEDTGIDYLFFDEAHEYKNLRTVSAIPGAAIAGSAKATKLHMVLSHLRERTASGRVATLATGTPVANSVTEAYVLMRYLAPDVLADMGVDAFDNWAATFGEVVSALEPDPKGGGYRYKARFSRFFNVPELMSAYRSFADVQMADDLKLPTPPVHAEKEDQRGETVVIPATGAQRDFIKSLKSQPWISKPGGVLKALGEGLRASLDLRLVGGVEEEGSKLSYAAEKITGIWRETKDTVYPTSKDDPTPQARPGGLQLVFLDEGTPGSGARHGMNLYADLRDQLVDQGMPREQIRFIHEAHTDVKKEKLFADCRAGKVAVLIGSTQKMGTGTNVQDRAVALHHLSYPWRPADMAQRDGRIERQGNLNFPGIDGTPDHVRILYYVTERTFDEFRLNTLARKAKFIGQIQRRNFREREIEDIGADAINLGLLNAIASGDPAVLQHAEAAAERVRLQGLARSWDREQDRRATQVGGADEFIDQAQAALAGMRAALPQRQPTTGNAFTMTVGTTTYSKREDAAAALGERMVALAGDRSLQPRQRVPVGRLGGLDFHAETVFNAKGARLLKLRFGWGHVVPPGHRDDRAQWSTDQITPDSGRGAIQALENFLSKLEKDTATLDAELTRQIDRRDEITAKLKPKHDNPYRAIARSKEREERLLGQLIIANEKKEELAERTQLAGDTIPDELRDEVDQVHGQVDGIKQELAEEHETQQRLDAAVRAERSAALAPQEAEDDASLEARPQTNAVLRDAMDALLSEMATGEQDAPDGTMSEADMALHDAQAMVGLLGGSAVVRNDGEFHGSVEPMPAQADSVDHQAEAQQQAGLSKEATTAPDVRDQDAPAATAPSPAADPEPPTADATPVPSPSTETETPDTAAAPPEAPESKAGDTGSGDEGTGEAPGQQDSDGEPVQTPDGPGRVLARQGEAVLVTTDVSTRVWNVTDLTSDTPGSPLSTPEASRKQRQNAEDAARAATSEGIELQYGHVLRDLDAEAGHGWVVDQEGEVIGWVRARIGDNGRRYWWGQDAAGGPPDNMPFHEELPASAGVPAIRAAGTVRPSYRAGQESGRTPTAPAYAAREITLTKARVRELRQLRLEGTLPKGEPVEPPEWVAEYRRYVLNVAQIEALSRAARTAARQLSTATAQGRRRQKVLLDAADKLDFEAYETGRQRATIPPPGETDPYADPYQAPAVPAAVDLPDGRQVASDAEQRVLADPTPPVLEDPPAEAGPAAALPDTSVPPAAPASDAMERGGPEQAGGDADLVGVLPMTDDEFTILLAASKALVAAGHNADATGWDTSVFLLGRSEEQSGVLADAATVERLVDDGALRYGAMMILDITAVGRERIAVLAQGRDEPAVGDRVVLPATGSVGIVCGYRTSELGARWADVVCDRDGWPQGWDTSVHPMYITTLELGVMTPEAAAELYRVAALREQAPGQQEAAELGADTEPQGLAETPPSPVPAAAEQTTLFDEPDNVPRADPQDDAAPAPAPANDVADAAEAPPGGQAAEPDTAGAAERKPRAVDDGAPPGEKAAPEAHAGEREDQDQDAAPSPEPADASTAEAAPQAAELPGEPEASPAPTIAPEPIPGGPDPSDVPPEPAGEPSWEAVEQYARTGRIPPRFESLEAWLGGAAEEARNQREEYLEALVTEEAERQQTESPSPAPVEPPRPAPAEPSHEEPANLSSADDTITDRPPLSREKPMTVQPEEAARASRPAPAKSPGQPYDASPDVFPWWDGFESADPIEPPDLDAAGAELREAFDDHVPDDQAMADEMWESVKPFLDFPTPEDAKEWRAAESTPSVDQPDGAEPTRPTPDRQEAAEALSEAIAGAERHEDVRSLPEWQKLQTVRGAAGHVWNVLREKAGAYFEQLRDDVRVQGFMRALSVRACEAIARVAQAAADRLRDGATTQELPSAEALLKVSKAALAYSNPQHQSPEAAPAAQPTSDVPDRQVLTAYASREDAVSASREIAQQFHTWATTPMGEELARSPHPLVSDFRRSWQQLPTADLPDGPGPAAGPYGAVAERANAVVMKALEQQGRFAPADVAALKTLADLAAVHGGRLAVTLPPGVTQAAVPQQMAPAPSVAVPAAAAAKGPRASL